VKLYKWFKQQWREDKVLFWGSSFMGTMMLALVLFASMAVLSACKIGTPANTRDLENVQPRIPDKVESYTNIDMHPNVVRLCIGGVGFVTTSRDYDAIMRVPEFDAWCKQ